MVNSNVTYFNKPRDLKRIIILSCTTTPYPLSLIDYYSFHPRVKSLNPLLYSSVFPSTQNFMAEIKLALIHVTKQLVALIH